MLIQWRDGQQTFQNVYFIFTSKNPMDGRGSRKDEEQFDEFEVTTSARSLQNENDDDDDEQLEEYEEDKYVLKRR